MLQRSKQTSKVQVHQSYQRGIVTRLGEEATLSLNQAMVQNPSLFELVFVHIPKNAGSAIEQSGLVSKPRSSWGFNAIVSGSNFTLLQKVTMPDGSLCSWNHVPPSLLGGFRLYEQAKDSFCIVRDPYERILSEYTYLLFRGRKGEIAHEDWELVRHDQCTAKGLNRFVQEAMGDFIAGKRFRFDCHLIPQSEFIWGSDGRRWCTHILQFSDLPASFNQLMEKKALPARLGRHRNSHASTCSNLKPSHITAENLEMLNRVYARDLAVVGQKLANSNKE